MRLRTPETGKPCDKCGATIRFRRHRDRGVWVPIDYHPANRSDLTTAHGGKFRELVFRMTAEGELVQATIRDYGNLWRAHRQTCKTEPDDRQAVIA